MFMYTSYTYACLCMRGIYMYMMKQGGIRLIRNTYACLPIRHIRMHLYVCVVFICI